MTYPRGCPRCEQSYALEGGPVAGSTTISTQPGGTPSASRPRDQGRLLLLRCMLCSDTYWWDYFGSAPAPAPHPERTSALE
ncbi:MAG: hypothetical protein IT307_00535 [Chloroflexi bacterium]|nr:hypothetical protein [Chloroflexota bacterium]